MAMANAINAAVQKTEPPLRYLTKSLVRTALKCPRKLVYANHPTLYPRSQEYVEDAMMQHVIREGERFGEYCKRLFPHGVEIGKYNGNSLILEDDALVSEKDLVSETNQMLMEGHHNQRGNNKRVTVFEGAISHGSFYVRPDILDKITVKTGEDTNATELRIIEVKSKSWDSSRDTVESKMWTANKKSIKSLYLPYIQDIAFQSLVCRAAYPDLRVSSWLMMPDRAKKMKYNNNSGSGGHEHHGGNLANGNGMVPTVEDTIQTIDGSIASILNVDELVKRALLSEAVYPGSVKGEKFKDVVQRWAEQLNDDDNSNNFGLDSFSTTPIGMQCVSCEYRSRNLSPDENKYSGFDICWQNNTARIGTAEKLCKGSLIVDLYGNTKKLMKTFLSEEKYCFSDLSASDFDLSEDGIPLLDDGTESKKKTATGNRGPITKSQRQWYQVQTHRRSEESSSGNPNNLHHPRYIIRREPLEREMKKWRYPLHFIDFETISPVIPYYEDMSPYEIFAFQFSHHTVSQSSDGTLEVKHASEFLHTERGSPNVAFLKSLLNAIGNVSADGGTVFQWSPHENTVLRAMLSSEDSNSLSPHEVSALSSILSTGSHPMVDLCKLAQKYYYVDGSEGSSSIKRLLKPTLNASDHLKTMYGSPTYNGRNFKDFQWYQIDNGRGCAKDPYDILSGENPELDSANVTKGGGAVAAFNELQNNLHLDEQDRKAIQNSLLRYCELDTLAMVMIVQAWQGFLNDETQRE